jgi:membrane-bound ClpP family serine protease
MKYIYKVGLILIIVGTILVVYQLLTGDGNTALTKSTGFYIFIVGLLTAGIGKLLIKKKKKD